MRTYLITGASSGIGAACAKKLSAHGHNLVLVARNEEKLKTFAAALGGNHAVYAYDLEDTEHIRSIFDFCREHRLKLDGMIYCAGLDAEAPIKGCTAALWERAMKINCISFGEMGRLFYSKRYSNDYARVVAISSSASVSCDKGMGPYSASKAALNAVVKTMAKEFVRRGILVNAVLPAGVLTPMAVAKIQKMTGQWIDCEGREMEIESRPIEIQEDSVQPYGLITPQNLAAFISYLVSPSNRYITGALLPVSAGLPF